MPERVMLPLESLLQAELPEDEANPPEPDVQRGRQAVGAIPLAEAVFESVAGAVAALEDQDPYVRAVVRGTARSVRAHAQALHILAENELWVPLICELRGFLEAVVALGAMWRDPDEAAGMALELRRVNIRERMVSLGCEKVHKQIYGPLSNVAHNGYSAMTCQTQSEDTPVDEPLPEIDAESDHYLVGLLGGGFVMTFRPIPARVAHARYLPMVATVVLSAARWLARETGLQEDSAASAAGIWLAAHGVSDFDCFPQG